MDGGERWQCVWSARRVAACFRGSTTRGIALPVSEAAATNWFIWALGALSVRPRWVWWSCPRGLRRFGWCLPCGARWVWRKFCRSLRSGLAARCRMAADASSGFGFLHLLHSAVIRDQSRQRQLLLCRAGSRAATLDVLILLYLTHLFVLMNGNCFALRDSTRTSRWDNVPLSVIFAWVF